MMVRTTTPAMRAILLVGSALVFVTGVQLYLLSTETRAFFAWTVSPPLTAASLGAFYWTALVLATLSAGERIWARARVGVGGILLFVTLTMVATLLHLDRFHLNSPDPTASAAAWLWLAIYMLDPPILLAILVLQLRQSGVDPPRARLLPAWFRIGLGAQASVLLAIGGVLFLMPSASASIWPWTLTPLTARALSAWLLALASVLVQGIREDDWTRLRAATLSYGVLAALQLLALARFPGDVRWNSPVATLYVAFLVGALLLGGAGYLSAARSSHRWIGPPGQSSPWPGRPLRLDGPSARTRPVR
jgi:hypothetical protein